MILFWVLAGGLTAGAVLLAWAQAAGAARRAAAGEADPTLSVHERQLSELDDLHRRGLLADDELAAAQAEAGRRLLAAADREAPVETPGGRSSRLAVTLGASATAALALGLYLALGKAGASDAPYRARLATWRAGDPGQLDAPRLAAVLKALAAERPNDPQAFDFLGRAEMASGDAGEAAAAFAHAARLAPANADYPAAAGEALLVGSENKVGPEAEALFREALRRDPKNAAARFQLARLAIGQGDRAAGVAAWRALAADLPADDPRKAELLAEIARAEGGPLPASSGAQALSQAAEAARGAPAAGPEQQAFIRAMVDRLAQRLASSPEDADGWARLVRAYRVLGDKEALAQALARARTVFARRPSELARIEAEAR